MLQSMRLQRVRHDQVTEQLQHLTEDEDVSMMTIVWVILKKGQRGAVLPAHWETEWSWSLLLGLSQTWKPSRRPARPGISLKEQVQMSTLLSQPRRGTPPCVSSACFNAEDWRTKMRKPSEDSDLSFCVCVCNSTSWCLLCLCLFPALIYTFIHSLICWFY